MLELAKVVTGWWILCHTGNCTMYDTEDHLISYQAEPWVMHHEGYYTRLGRVLCMLQRDIILDWSLCYVWYWGLLHQTGPCVMYDTEGWHTRLDTGYHPRIAQCYGWFWGMLNQNRPCVMYDTDGWHTRLGPGYHTRMGPVLCTILRDVKPG